MGGGGPGMGNVAPNRGGHQQQQQPMTAPDIFYTQLGMGTLSPPQRQQQQHQQQQPMMSTSIMAMPPPTGMTVQATERHAGMAGQGRSVPEAGGGTGAGGGAGPVVKTKPQLMTASAAAAAALTVCKFFLSGSCTLGAQCRFKHEPMEQATQHQPHDRRRVIENKHSTDAGTPPPRVARLYELPSCLSYRSECLFSMSLLTGYGPGFDPSYQQRGGGGFESVHEMSRGRRPGLSPGLSPGLKTAAGPKPAPGPGLKPAPGPGLKSALGPGLKPALGPTPGIDPGTGRAEQILLATS